MKGIIDDVLLNFVMSLSGANSKESAELINEVILNRQFHDQLHLNRAKSGKHVTAWGLAISPRIGSALYTLCREIKPGIVIETGVSSGVSSAYILAALEANKYGDLYSIDIASRPQQVGWVIPEYLRQRWHLVSGKSSDKLPTLFKDIRTVDIFFHDSDHSYENMMWEFENAWKHLRSGGLLLSHNIDFNNSFSDFCWRVDLKGCVLEDLGGLVKA
jgi:predicted O-methyltransferase YrrM